MKLPNQSLRDFFLIEGLFVGISKAGEFQFVQRASRFWETTSCIQEQNYNSILRMRNEITQ